jgi:hypothetical protein
MTDIDATTTLSMNKINIKYLNENEFVINIAILNLLILLS